MPTSQTRRIQSVRDGGEQVLDGEVRDREGRLVDGDPLLRLDHLGGGGGGGLGGTLPSSR